MLPSSGAKTLSATRTERRVAGFLEGDGATDSASAPDRRTRAIRAVTAVRPARALRDQLAAQRPRSVRAAVQPRIDCSQRNDLVGD